MHNAVAFSDNDVVVIAWSYAKKPDGCLGFAIYRIDAKGRESILPSHAVFPGGVIGPKQTTADFPVQKFYWKDPYARLEADKTGQRTFRYKVVPLSGKPGALQPMKALPFLISNEVDLSPDTSSSIKAYFNRGMLSTQHVSDALKGKPSAVALKQQINDPKSALRSSLSGDMFEALTGFVDRAKSSGTIYAALYELQDEPLIRKLESLGTRLQIVLSNSVAVDPDTKQQTDANQPAHDRLAKSTKGQAMARIMPSNHIGHNKFLVFVNKAGKSKAVLFGSTNWTANGLCAQTNNTLVVDDDNLAARYLDYWKQLAADTKAAKGVANQLQGVKLRTWDAKGKDLVVDDDAVQSWFSPNTPKARGKSKTKEAHPPDMAALIERIQNAKHAVLFLAFYPGTPSIANWIADAARQNRDLFVRGCVTNPSAAEGFYYELKGMPVPKKVQGQKVPEDPRVIDAEALDGKILPAGWKRELLKAGFAVVHDKVVVIDPFADNCVVVTGSHNLGHKASYDNDENLVIIEGNRKLATAYATHVLDVYDHFSWRYAVKHGSAKDSDPTLKTKPDDWLVRYYDASGQISNPQLKFWLQGSGL